METGDRGYEGATALHQALDAAGVRHVWFEGPGSHEWQVWRKHLQDFAPRLFRPGAVKKPSRKRSGCLAGTVSSYRFVAHGGGSPRSAGSENSDGLTSQAQLDGCPLCRRSGGPLDADQPSSHGRWYLATGFGVGQPEREGGRGTSPAICTDII